MDKAPILIEPIAHFFVRDSKRKFREKERERNKERKRERERESVCVT